ncbi:MAG: MlaD family protein [Bacteroidota bacterium]|nr:MlaD family protein [Bacteroidota bacterium]
MKTSLSRARVGFLIFVGVLTFVVAIFLIGQQTQLFTSTFTVYVNFSNTEGVKPGTFVLLSGYTIGSVRDIQLSETGDSIRLVLRITERVHPFIKSDSKAEIKQEGLVGNKLINIIIGSPSLPPLPDGGYIQGVPPFALTSLADNLTAITDTSKIISGELKTFLTRLNRGEGTLGRLLTDESVYRNLLSVTTMADSGMGIVMTELGELSDVLRKFTVSVDDLVRRSDTTVSAVTLATKELEELLRSINEGEGTAGAFVRDRRLYDSLLALVGSLNDAAYEVGSASNQLAQGVYALRTHWLFGRVFGGKKEGAAEPPASAYRRLMRELQERAAELDRRERELREREERLNREGRGGER